MGVTTSNDTRHSLLQRMSRALDAGAIIIGESHHNAQAREAIVYLIVNKKITVLSIEGPMLAAGFRNNDGSMELNPQKVERYLGMASLKPNDDYSFQKVISIAHKYSVKVYFHDVPARFMSGGDVGFENKVVKISTDGGANVNRGRPVDSLKLAVRNRFSAQLLRQEVGDQVAAKKHLAILVGSDHTRPGEDMQGAKGVIQACLGIPEDRVFVLEN